MCGVMMAGANGYTAGATKCVSALVRFCMTNQASDSLNKMTNQIGITVKAQ